MPPLVIALITLFALCGGGLLGSILRDRLPDHHIRDDSKDIVKTTSGMIATLVALVIGLLVSSAKSSFDQANDGLTLVGSRVILLDRSLRRYGPEADAARRKTKETLELALARLWSHGPGPREGIAGIERGRGLDDLNDLLERLAPASDDEPRRAIKASALALCNELTQSRWLMIEKAQGELPVPLITMLIFWLTVLFTSLGVLTPRNSTTIVCLFVSALSMAGAILLLMELNSPFDGLIQASPAPLLKALSFVTAGTGT